MPHLRMGRYATARRVTISWDEQMEAWRLEAWGDGDLALALWPLTDLNGLDDAAYAVVSTILANVGLADHGRSTWVEKNDSWQTLIAPLPEQ
jgi:hypothetical protein